MRNLKPTAIAATAALGLLVLAGCGGGDASNDQGGDGGNASATDDDDNDNDTDDDGTGRPSGPNVGTGAKTAMAALDTAEKDVKDGTAFELDLDDDGGGGWDVTVASGTKAQYEVRVAEDGAKVESNNKDDDTDEDLGKLGGVDLTAGKAAERAADDHAGDVTGVDFEVRNDGTETWQVTLNDNGSSTEYTLDANSGKTLGEEKDD